MQTDVHKTAYLVYTTKKMPHVTVIVTKLRFVGRNSQVITIIYPTGYMQILKSS